MEDNSGTHPDLKDLGLLREPSLKKSWLRRFWEWYRIPLTRKQEEEAAWQDVDEE